MLLGSHISIAEEKYKAFLRAESIHINAMQIFTKSNRQWKSKELTQEEIDLFLKTFKQSNIQFIVAHATYLINIGSSNKELNQKSAYALKDELNRCSALTIPYLVLHPGSYQESSKEDCIERIAENINNIYLNNKDIKTSILLELTAGQGTSVGCSFEQLKAIHDKIEYKSKIGVCFDTCHAFVAGYDFTTQEKYEKIWKQFDEIIGLNLLKVIHLNDSKGKLGSKSDRHEKIGKGQIGLKFFEMLMNDKKLFNVPKILETPIINSYEEYAADLETLIKLIYPENLKLLLNSPLEAYTKKRES